MCLGRQTTRVIQHYEALLRIFDYHNCFMPAGGGNLLPPPLCRYYMVRTLGGLRAPGFTFRLQVQGARAAKGGVLCRAPPWPAVLGWALKVTSPCCFRSRPSGSSQGLAYWRARGLLPAWGARPHGLCCPQNMHPGFTVEYLWLP